MKIPLALGEAKRGLYIFYSRSFPSNPEQSNPRSFKFTFNSLNSVSSSIVCSTSEFPILASSNVCSSPSIHALSSSTSSNDVIDKLWYYRLGHFPIYNMKNITSIYPSISSKFSTPCDICPLARQHKLPFTTSSISAKFYFQLIHIDTWGPYNTSTYNGFKYFLTIVDDFSRGTWTFLLSTKSSVFDILKSFLSMVERQFYTKV